MTATEVYWIMQALDIKVTFMVFTVLSFMFALITFFVWANINSVFCLKTLKISSCFFIVTLMGAIFIPSTKTLMMMYVVPKITNNEVVDTLSKDGQRLYKLGIERLEKELKGSEK